MRMLIVGPGVLTCIVCNGSEAVNRPTAGACRSRKLCQSHRPPSFGAPRGAVARPNRRPRCPSHLRRYKRPETDCLQRRRVNVKYDTPWFAIIRRNDRCPDCGCAMYCAVYHGMSWDMCMAADYRSHFGELRDFCSCGQVCKVGIAQPPPFVARPMNDLCIENWHMSHDHDLPHTRVILKLGQSSDESSRH